jgi:Mor family transcriptional regulator
MKGSEVLPARLLKEIQEYVEGSLLYIPKKTSKAGWGSKSGARQLIDRRNSAIYTLYKRGVSIANLAEQYHLSEDTVRKIVYRRK